MDDDVHVVGIVERHSGAIEGCVVEVPFRRSKPPDESREIASVFIVACATAVGGKIELVPPLQLGLGRQRYSAGLLTADQIAAHRDHGLAALGPQRGDDVSSARTPVESRDGCPFNLEGVHQFDGVHRDRGWLPVAERATRQKPRRPVPAQVRDDDAVAGGSEDGKPVSREELGIDTDGGDTAAGRGSSDVEAETQTAGGEDQA